MTDQKLQQYIHDWLKKNHAPEAHATILGKVLAVGKPSKPWVETIQRYVQGVTFHTPDRGGIKRACRALSENIGVNMSRSLTQHDKTGYRNPCLCQIPGVSQKEEL